MGSREQYQALPRDRVLKGIGCILLSTVTAVTMNVLVRQAAETQHPFEIAFFRNLFGFLVLLPLIYRAGATAVFRTSRIGLHVLRGIFNTLGMLTFFLALTLAPLAHVQALTFTAPLFTMLGAALLLKERVDGGRWAAIALGLVGTLLILRPGAEAINLGGILTLVSAAAWASAMLVIKVMTRTESSLTITAYAALFVAALSLPVVIPVWVMPTPHELALFGLIGLVGSIGQLALAQSFRYAEASLVLPFDFAKLIWATIAGFVIFAEFPDTVALLGGVVVFASVLFVARRETRQRSREIVALSAAAAASAATAAVVSGEEAGAKPAAASGDKGR